MISGGNTQNPANNNPSITAIALAISAGAYPARSLGHKESCALVPYALAA
ncbi:hypothetical protein I553_6569 [Mycobacterium xenopi 4042]|uniref:Uncharacterized protein n=1 Tax=Mycobacterium xenopi 4042 TaxID=1299334 RepID=X8BFR0_MYCXE|nr:hypothetical protein I553_6569 [Mycobacterium xenopi 4042]